MWPTGAIERNARSTRACVTKVAIQRELPRRSVDLKHPHATLGRWGGIADDDAARAVGSKPVRTLSFVESNGRHPADGLQVADVERRDAMSGGVRLKPIVSDHH